jgi:hypothetical protein
MILGRVIVEGLIALRDDNQNGDSNSRFLPFDFAQGAK